MIWYSSVNCDTEEWTPGIEGKYFLFSSSIYCDIQRSYVLQWKIVKYFHGKSEFWICCGFNVMSTPHWISIPPLLFRAVPSRSFQLIPKMFSPDLAELLNVVFLGPGIYCLCLCLRAVSGRESSSQYCLEVGVSCLLTINSFWRRNLWFKPSIWWPVTPTSPEFHCCCYSRTNMAFSIQSPL